MATPTDTYHLLPIAGALIIVYASSLYCSRKKIIIDIPTHRRIWNALLISVFSITAATAILYLLQYDYGLRLPSWLDVSFWHAEFGIVMVGIATFHALWHIPYFQQYLPSPRARAGGNQPSGGPAQKAEPKKEEPKQQAPAAPS
jgi:hypothetical protein